MAQANILHFAEEAEGAGEAGALCARADEDGVGLCVGLYAPPLHDGKDVERLIAAGLAEPDIVHKHIEVAYSGAVGEKQSAEDGDTFCLEPTLEEQGQATTICGGIQKHALAMQTAHKLAGMLDLAVCAVERERGGGRGGIKADTRVRMHLAQHGGSNFALAVLHGDVEHGVVRDFACGSAVGGHVVKVLERNIRAAGNATAVDERIERSDGGPQLRGQEFRLKDKQRRANVLEPPQGGNERGVVSHNIVSRRSVALLHDTS